MNPDRKNSVLLTSGSPWLSIWHMSWPMLLIMLFQFFVGLTDIYVAGFLGPEVQAIVGFTGQLYFFIVIIANALSIGTVALFSRSYAAGNQAAADHIGRQSLMLGSVCALFLTFFGLFFRYEIVLFAGFPDKLRPMASEFISLFSIALVPTYCVIIANAIFRAAGEVRLTLICMLLVSLLNILLNIILVLGAFSFTGMGYRGIALSTALAMAFGMGISLVLFRQSVSRGILSGRWVLSAGSMKTISRLSWPAAILQISWSTGSIVLYNILGRLDAAGITAMAALTNGLRIEAVIYLPAFALNMAASVLMGQNLGSGAPARAERLGWKISGAGVLFVSIMSLPIFIWPEVFSSPFTRDPAVLSETARYLRLNMLSEPFMALSAILGGSLQGAGDTRGTMFIIVVAMWIIRLPLAYYLGIQAGYGALGVWIAMVTSMVVQGLLMTLRFRRGKWKEIEVLS